MNIKNKIYPNSILTSAEEKKYFIYNKIQWQGFILFKIIFDAYGKNVKFWTLKGIFFHSFTQKSFIFPNSENKIINFYFLATLKGKNYFQRGKGVGG